MATFVVEWFAQNVFPVENQTRESTQELFYIVSGLVFVVTSLFPTSIVH